MAYYAPPCLGVFWYAESLTIIMHLVNLKTSEPLGFYSQTSITDRAPSEQFKANAKLNVIPLHKGFTPL